MIIQRIREDLLHLFTSRVGYEVGWDLIRCLVKEESFAEELVSEAINYIEVMLDIYSRAILEEEVNRVYTEMMRWYSVDEGNYTAYWTNLFKLLQQKE